MKKAVVIISCQLFFTIFLCHAQLLHPILITPLPPVIGESSGVEISNSSNIWTHNDSGSGPLLFNIDSSGNLLRTVVIDVDTAMDWEDITRDKNGNLFIGDFGNNLNNRTDLRIFKIQDPDIIVSDTLVTQLISFTLPDQTLFPPPLSEQNFDLESVFHFHDSLYLFSKNRGTSNYCKLYRLPDQAGDYIAELIDSVNTGSWITSADISPSGKTMVLLSEAQVMLFTGFTGTDFFGGMKLQLSMDSSKKEGIVFVNDTLVYITDEKVLTVGGNLYSLNLSPWINAIDDFSPAGNLVCIAPNPSSSEVIMRFPLGVEQITVTNSIGQLVERFNLKNESTLTVRFPYSGLYFVRLDGSSFSILKEVVIIKLPR